MGYVILGVIILIIVVAVVNTIKEQNNYVNKRVSEGTNKYQAMQEYSNMLRDSNNKKKQIVNVVILNNNNINRKSAVSSITRGAVGSALVGPVGAVGGLMSGKTKGITKTTFVIEYADGHKETKILDSTSKEYKKLCTYVTNI